MKSKKSKLAIASFVLSLVPLVLPTYYALKIIARPPGGGGLLIMPTGPVWAFIITFIGSTPVAFWFSLLSVVLGIIALVKIKKNQIGGRWLAILGIVISVIIAMIMIVIGFLLGGY